MRQENDYYGNYRFRHWAVEEGPYYFFEFIIPKIFVHESIFEFFSFAEVIECLSIVKFIFMVQGVMMEN